MNEVKADQAHTQHPFLSLRRMRRIETVTRIRKRGVQTWTMITKERLRTRRWIFRPTPCILVLETDIEGEEEKGE